LAGHVARVRVRNSYKILVALYEYMNGCEDGSAEEWIRLARKGVEGRIEMGKRLSHVHISVY